MAIELKHAFEVASDIIGTISSVAIVWPVWGITRARERLDDRLREARRMDPNNATGLVEILLEEDRRTGEFDRWDGTLLKFGFGTLILSFVLRLAYHCVG